MRRMLLTGRTIRLTGDDGTMADRLVAHGATLDDDGAVAVHVVSVSTVEQPLAETNAAEWAERCDAPILAAIDAAQEAHRRHASKLVFVVPVLGMTGAAGLVASATAAEAVRALARVAARHWGPEGMSVSCVATRAAGPITAPQSLPDPTDDDVAGVVALLAHELAFAATGGTVIVDGGVVLNP